MSPKYRYEPEARVEQVKNYPSRYGKDAVVNVREKRVHKKDLQWYRAN